MTGFTLNDRLKRASESLKAVQATLGRLPGRLPVGLEGVVRELTASHSEIDRWILSLHARETGRLILANLDKPLNSASEEITAGGVQMHFEEARLFFVHGYLSITWALADRISEFVSRVLCVDSVARVPRSPAKLTDYFIHDGKSTTSLVYGFSRESFGWPVGLSYVIRNHFAHDCAHRNGWAFFDGPTISAGFRISQDGWDHVQETAQREYKVDPTHTRAPESWPWPQDDLRKVFDICHREMDDALGILLGSACATLKAHVELLVGEA